MEGGTLLFHMIPE